LQLWPSRALAHVAHAATAVEHAAGGVNVVVNGPRFAPTWPTTGSASEAGSAASEDAVEPAAIEDVVAIVGAGAVTVVLANEADVVGAAFPPPPRRLDSVKPRRAIVSAGRSKFG
jgi:hypothetical protein